MKSHIHNIYVTNKIVINLQLIHRAVLEKLRFKKKGYKNCNLKYLWNLWTNDFVQRTRPRSIQNLPPQRILKRLRQFYSRNCWMYKTHFIHLSGFFVFVNKNRTVIARKLFFLENIGILSPFRMLPIRFRYMETFSKNYDLEKRLKKF